MHAFLIITKNNALLDEEIENLVKKNKSKKLDFELKKISEVRDLISFTNISSNELQTIVIKNIHLASKEAQNSMLKLIEEPRKNLNFIFSATSEKLILPTILSRCQIIKPNLKKLNLTHEIEFANNFENLSIGEKFETISKITKREDALNFLNSLLIGYEQHLSKNKNYSKTIENLLIAQNRILKNANVELQLTNFLINSYST